MEEEQNRISISSQEGATPFITGKPFFIDTRTLSSKIVDDIEARGMTIDEIKYPLGFSDLEIQEWKDNNIQLLEIGPGKGTSFKWLKDNGFNIRALEPALRYFGEDVEESDAAEAKTNLAEYNKTGEVSSANAVDAKYAFPGIQFDIAFAIGPNFQTYSTSEHGFYAQLAGIIAVLKPIGSSYLTFLVNNKDGVVSVEGDRVEIHLAQKLSNLNIKYDIRSERDGGYAIRIYRINNMGEDCLPKLSSIIRS